MAHFTQTRNELASLAARCANSATGMSGLVDMLTREGTRLPGYGQASLPASTAEKIYVRPDNVRWFRSGDRVVANCGDRLRVETQTEAFTECVRVYLCGMNAASCGVNAAQASNQTNCTAISAQCLATNPVPSGLEDVAKRSAAPLQRATGPAGSRGSKSRITGPGDYTGGGSDSNRTAPAR